MDANFRSQSGLDILGGGTSERVFDDGGNVVLTQTITVTPQKNGLYHIDVFANVRTEGRLQSRVVSIPIQVGPKSSNQGIARKLESDTDVNGIPIKSTSAKTSVTAN